MEIFANRTYDLAVLTWLGATELLACTVDLFQNNIVVDENTAEGDLDIATYTGYGAETVTWHLPSIADDGTPELVSDLIVFRPSGTAVGNTIYGAYVKTGAAVYLGAGNLDTPAPMNATTDELAFVLRWRLGENPIVEVIS